MHVCVHPFQFWWVRDACLCASFSVLVGKGCMFVCILFSSGG